MRYYIIAGEASFNFLQLANAYSMDVTFSVFQFVSAVISANLSQPWKACPKSFSDEVSQLANADISFNSGQPATMPYIVTTLLTFQFSSPFNDVNELHL